MILKYDICIWYLEYCTVFYFVMYSILLCCVSAIGDVSDVHQMAGWFTSRLAASCLVEKGCTLFLNISPYIEMVLWDKKRVFCRSVILEIWWGKRCQTWWSVMFTCLQVRIVVSTYTLLVSSSDVCVLCHYFWTCSVPHRVCVFPFTSYTKVLCLCGINSIF